MLVESTFLVKSVAFGKASLNYNLLKPNKVRKLGFVRKGRVQLFLLSHQPLICVYLRLGRQARRYYAAAGLGSRVGFDVLNSSHSRNLSVAVDMIEREGACHLKKQG